MAKKTLEQTVKERYSDQAVQEEILKDVKEKGTEQRILSGELVLPDEHGATQWLKRLRGVEGLTEAQAQDKARMAALEQLVMEMADHIQKPSQERKAVIEERLKQLREGGN